MASRKPFLIVSPTACIASTRPGNLAKSVAANLHAAEKLCILNDADACTQPGQIGALLRREGLYSSHLVKWRRLRAAGHLQALAPQPRGPKPTPPDPVVEELTQLRMERLLSRLAQAELIIDVQKAGAGI